VLKQFRDKLLAHLPRSVRNIEAQVNNLVQMQSAQNLRLDAIERRVTNSGFVQLSDNEILAKIFTGAKMYLDPRDVGLVPHLILDGDWERNITQAWLSVLQPGDTILDIGTNFGYFSVLAAQQTQRDCNIVMFEANPELIPYIEKTVSVNSFDNCSHLVNAAVSDAKGKLMLNVLEDFIASSSVHDINELNQYGHNANKLKVARSVEVQAVTVDDYCDENKVSAIDVIKMDIEGFEDRAYAGMRKMIKSSPRATMFIEFTKDGYKAPKKFYDQMLKDFGHVYLISPEGQITKQQETSYEAVIDTTADWVMPIFSKRTDLASSFV
jgi:FkbM family methyltransferase